LNTGERRTSVRYERWHGMHAQGCRCTLVSHYVFFKLTLCQCAPQLFGVELQLFRELDEYFYLPNVLTALKEGAEHSFVIIVETIYSRGPLRSLMTQARSWLHRREFHDDSELVSEWVDPITPHTR